MKQFTILFVILCALVFASGCRLLNTNDTASFNITKDDETKIFKYLDYNTNDVIKPNRPEGKMYSSFLILGTDKNHIYLLVHIVEYSTIKGKLEAGDAVYTPMVLNIKKESNSFFIKSHRTPEEGMNYGKSLDRLFPDYISVSRTDEETKRLEQEAKIRAEEDLGK